MTNPTTTNQTMSTAALSAVTGGLERLDRVWAAAGLAAILFIAVNVLAQGLLRDARLDLTADRLYTLSPGTLNVLKGLKEPVTLKLFYSASLADEVPAIRTYGQRVRELLEAYVHHSDGKLKLRVIDPEPFSDAEDQAVEAGIQGVPLDRSGGKQFYFGLVGADSTDRREVIGFFQTEREPFLEYDLTKMIYALGEVRKPVLGILSDMPLEYGQGGVMRAMRGGSEPYAVWTQLKGFFDTRMLKTDIAEIPGDVAVLMVARPRNLPEPALYAVDQFVLRGGRTIILADPYVESEAEGGMGQPAPVDPAAIPSKLFDAWGLTLPANRFVADPAIALEVQSGAAGHGGSTIYPPWLGLSATERDRNDVVTADLGMVNMASAGALGVKEGAGLKLTPLLFASSEARLGDTTLLRGPADPKRVSKALDTPPVTHAPVLAARVEGTAKTAFPEGPPPPETRPGDVVTAPVPLSTPHLAKNAEPLRLVVITDSDLLEDRFWVESRNLLGQRYAVPFAANGDLVLNLVENMAGSADLIGLRGRAGSSRPFLLVDRLRRAAGERMLARQDELTRELEDTERRIAELQSKTKEGGSALLSEEERRAIDDFRHKTLEIRKELRDVRHALNKDIERLSSAVKVINIIVVPLLVAFAAFAWAVWRRRARTAAAARLTAGTARPHHRATA